MRDGAPIDEYYPIRITLDIQGRQRAVSDALTQAGRVVIRLVMRYDYDLLGDHIHQASMEADERWMLNDVTGKPLYTWDSRGFTRRSTYDALRRPTELFVTESGVERLAERTLYGESQGDGDNHRTRVFQIFDGAGVVTSEAYDFKGNLLRSRRELLPNYKQAVNWQQDPVPNDGTFTSSTTYDALNRPIQLIAPHSDQPGTKFNIIQPSYNEANLLEQVHAWLNQDAEPAGWLEPATANLHAVSNIDYNAKGQRTRIDYGNSASTVYDYDPLTFRLLHLLTQRNAVDFPDDCPQPPPAGWPGCQVQNLHYTYDPIGNITYIRDDAQQIIYFRNKRIEPSAEYTYDAIYRLIEATGREHLGQVGGAPIPHSYNDAPRVGLLHPGDGNAMGTYTEHYVYDAVGNFLEMRHRGSDPANPPWTRTYAYNEASLLERGKQSNRLSSTTVSDGDSITEQYGYDAHGNMLRMPHLQVMQWDFKDQLLATAQQIVNNGGTPETTYYVYGANGQRIRKVTELATGQVKDERIYLDGFEVYRKNGANSLVRETLHIMDDKQRIALVETRTQGNDPAPQQLIRYQFGNHLGSVSLELADQAQIVSYEEYTPYGSTSYQAVRSQTEIPKRYRYTSKERDEETGLAYHSARYYAPWLGRWMSSDPAGLVGGINLYSASRNNPLRLIDTSGTTPRNAEAIIHDIERVYQQREQTQRKVVDLENSLITAEDTLNSLRNSSPPLGRLRVQRELIRESERHVTRLRNQIRAANQQIASLETEINRLTREGALADIDHDRILRAQGLQDPLSPESEMEPLESFDRALRNRRGRPPSGGSSGNGPPEPPAGGGGNAGPPPPAGGGGSSGSPPPAGGRGSGGSPPSTGGFFSRVGRSFSRVRAVSRTIAQEVRAAGRGIVTEARALGSGAVRVGASLSRASSAIVRWAGPAAEFLWIYNAARGEPILPWLQSYQNMEAGQRVQDIHGHQGTVIVEPSGTRRIEWDYLGAI